MDIGVNVLKVRAHLHSCVAPVDKEVALNTETALGDGADQAVNYGDWLFWIDSILCFQVEETVNVLFLLATTT